MKKNTFKKTLGLFALPLLLLSCGGGGGGGPQNPANFRQEPKVKIDMKGTWEVRSIKVIETTEPNLNPDFEDDLVVLTSTGILQWNDLVFTEENLSREEGRKFDWYVNKADQSRLDFGYGWDLLEKGKDYGQVGLRGVAFDENTLLMEYQEYYQAGKNDPKDFIKLHFLLKRKSYLTSQIQFTSKKLKMVNEKKSIAVKDWRRALKKAFSKSSLKKE